MAGFPWARDRAPGGSDAESSGNSNARLHTSPRKNRRKSGGANSRRQIRRRHRTRPHSRPTAEIIALPPPSCPKRDRQVPAGASPEKQPRRPPPVWSEQSASPLRSTSRQSRAPRQSRESARPVHDVPVRPYHPRFTSAATAIAWESMWERLSHTCVAPTCSSNAWALASSRTSGSLREPW